MTDITGLQADVAKLRTGYEKLRADIATATAQALRLRESHDRLLATLKRVSAWMNSVDAADDQAEIEEAVDDAIAEAGDV